MSSQFRTLILAIFALACLSACGKQYSADPDAKEKKAKISLVGLPLNEALKAKYNAILAICQLVSNDGKSLVTREVSWDLIANFAEEKTGRMRISDDVENFKSSIEVKATFNQATLTPHREYRDDAGQTYHMKNSPQIRLTLKWRSVHHQNGDDLVQAGSYKEVFLIEGVAPTVFELVSSSPDSPARTIQVKCSLQTQLKPQYLDEFSKVDANKKEF